MRIVLPIVYFRCSIAAQEKFAQKVKECLMARTLDLIRGYMFSPRMEPRGAGTGSDPAQKLSVRTGLARQMSKVSVKMLLTTRHRGFSKNVRF